MDRTYLEGILNKVATGEISTDKALESLKNLPFESLPFANVDSHRAIRTGHPETVFCQGKTSAQVAEIMLTLAKTNSNILGTRASLEQFQAVLEVLPEAMYHQASRVIVVGDRVSGGEVLQGNSNKVIAVITAGTADIPVAEEAAITAQVFGNRVDRVYDVGVAGIHRLFAQLDRIRKAHVCIVVAGMEGALASVVGGLVETPVIAVPTSIGYGANLGGLSALLSMLNSCGNGIGVVNIDNGFGAGYLASVIVKDREI